MCILKNKLAIIALFENLPDPRIDRKRVYPYAEVHFLICLARSFGFKSSYQIMKFGAEEDKLLTTFFPYRNGLPSHDTITRCRRLMGDEELEKLYSSFTQFVSSKAIGQA